MLTLLTLLYYTYLLTSVDKSPRPEAYALKHSYALKETRFTVCKETGMQAAVWVLQAAAGWGL